MNRLDQLILILSCLAVAPEVQAEAATWQVATSRTDASDDNPGTALKPWKTISKAAALLEPGDTVIIHGGIYREYVHPARRGTLAQPITYQGATGEEVVISGADVVTGWVPAGGKLWKKQPWPYHFPTHPANQHLVGRCEQVIVAGRLLRQVEQRSEMMEGTFCANTASEVLYVRLPGDADPSAQLVEVSVRPVCFGVGFQCEPRESIHVRGLTVRYAANAAQRALAAAGDHWLIEDCRVEWTNGTGLSFTGKDTTLRRVRADHNGQQGLGGHSDGFLLEDVVLDHNNVKGFPKGWEAGGMKLARARQGVVRRCQAIANDGVGLWFDVDVRDVLVEQCLCQDNAGPGIEVEISGGFHIQNNLCVHNGTDKHWCGAGILLAESDHCTVEHNTCVLNPTGISIREQGPRNVAPPSSEPVIYHVHDIAIRRNVCALNARYQFGLWWDNVFFGGKLLTKEGQPRTAYDPETSHLCLDHNLYWPSSAAELTLWGCPWLPKHTEYIDLAAWQTQRKQDAHSRVADPQFVPAAVDWKVKPGSPALKLGAGPTEPPAALTSVAGVEARAAHEPATTPLKATGATDTSFLSGRPRYYYPLLAAEPPQDVTADVCVYGATPGGVTAAIQARRMGKRAILVEFGRNVGGMTASGLSDTDGGEPAITGGLAAEFYRRVGQRNKFPPSQAERAFRAMLAKAKVPLYFEHRLRSVSKQGNRITEILTENGNRFRARMFVDATYEGDLLARAGVSYTVGREGNAKYGESINGVIYGPKDNFDRPVDPYRIPGRPDSGLLAGVDASRPGQVGQGDRRVQAYNFRMWLVPASVGRPFPKPAGYDPGRYALLLRYIAAGNRHVDLRVGDNNNHHLFNGAFSTDDIGANYAWPEADYATREKIYQEHVTYQQGLMYFLATDARVPAEIRAKVSCLALPKDEFVATGGWPHQLYVREARRMLSPYVMTEHNGRGKVVAEDSVALASYQMDSHNTCRLVVDGKACNEGQTYKAVAHPLPLSYRAICPRQSECGNLLVVFCISASHVGLSTLRMEPVLMITGQSAGTAACLAIDAGCDVQDLPYLVLRQRLLRDGQILDPPLPAKKATGIPAGFMMAPGNRFCIVALGMAERIGE